MRRFVLCGLLWLFCLGSLPGCSTEDTGKASGTSGFSKRSRVPKGHAR